VGRGVCEQTERRQAIGDDLPLTVVLIAIILYSMFKSFKWAGLILVN